MTPSRWPAVFALSILLSAAPGLALGQEATAFRVGAGPAYADRTGSPWGGHALVGMSRTLNSALSVRGDAFLAFTGLAQSGGGALTGGDATLVLRRPGDGVSPYLGAGVGYTRTDNRPDVPLSYDLGASFLVGVDGLGGSGRWFVEARTRFFGNVFYERASTQSLLLVTVGRWW